MNQLGLFRQRHDSELTDEEIFDDMKDFSWLKGSSDNLKVYFKGVTPRLEKIGRQDLILDLEKRLRQLKGVENERD
jgi:hypothetical protein